MSCCWLCFQEPTLEDILAEQTGEFAHEGDSVAAAGKAISRSKKAVSRLTIQYSSKKALQACGLAFFFFWPGRTAVFQFNISTSLV